MFGKSKKEEKVRSLDEVVKELNQALSDEEVSKEFTEMIDQYAALKELKARISAKQNDIKALIEAEYEEQGMSENVKRNGVTVGTSLATTIVTDSDTYDAAKLYKKYPEAMKISISPSYIKTMMKDKTKAEVLTKMGVSLGEERTFKVT